MMQNFNYFWSFMHGSPAVQELLNNPDLKVEELLEEDGLLIELKTSNQKLLNFLLREESFKQLIHYVISEPDPEEAKTNKKKCYKYPFICADVLSSDSQAIVTEFFKTNQELKEVSAIHKAEEAEDNDEVNLEGEPSDKTESTETSTIKQDKSADEEEKSPVADANEAPYLNYLFSFLDSEELNLTSAGYFAKIVNNLFSKKPSSLIIYLYEQNPSVLEKLAKHIASKSVAEFLAKTLTFESSMLLNTDDEVYNTKRIEVLKSVIQKLEPKNDIEEINNSAYLICEVLGKYSSMHSSQEILQNLLDKTTIDHFFEIIKSKDSISCCAVALILGNIFAYYILINTPKYPDENSQDEGQTNYPQQLELSENIPLVAAFISNLENIVQYICNSTGEAFASQYGAQVVPFGSARIKLVELIIIAMKANNLTIYTKLSEYGFFTNLLNLMIKYEWNNMLHNQIEKIILIVLDSTQDELKNALFNKAAILDFIVNAFRVTEYTLPGKHARKIVRGYTGQLTKIANRIVENKDSEVLKYSETNENWKDFVENQLSEINKKNDIKLGGRDPRGNDEEDFDTHLGLPGIMQKFDKYFMKGNENKEKDDDEEEDDDEKDDDDLNKAKEDEDEDEEEEEEEEDSRVAGYKAMFGDSDKHVIKFGGEKKEDDDEGTNYRGKGRNSFGKKNYYDDDDEEEEHKEEQGEIGEDNKYTVIMNEMHVDESVKSEEQVLDPTFNTNSYWKKDSWHTADDILKEIEGL